MNIHFTLKELLIYQVALFSIFSPFAVVGTHSALPFGFSSAARNKISVWIGFYTVLNLIVIAQASQAATFGGITLLCLASMIFTTGLKELLSGHE